MSEIKLIVEPDEEEPGAFKIWVQGTVDGRPYRFLLDTGAARSSLMSDEYTSQLVPKGADNSSGLFASTRADLITVDGLKLGPIWRSEFALARAAPSAEGHANVIGMDLLSEHRCHFIFSKDRLLVDPDSLALDAREQHDLILDARLHPYIDAAVGGTTANAVWDTGASLTVVDAKMIQKSPNHFQEAGSSTGTDASGASRITPMFVMQGLEIRGVPFPPHKVAQVDLAQVNATLEVAMDLVLGNNILMEADWLMDFPAERWGFTRVPGWRDP